MKISVIVPIYNAEKTIERLLNSINSQTYKNYEIILVNDGSTDNTQNILNKYKSEKVKIINKKNEGVGKARKVGFNHATGDLIFFCDSDDYLPNNQIFEKINNKFIDNNIDILMFDVIDITTDGEKIVNCFSKNFDYGLHKVEEINDCFLYGPLFLKIFKREKLSENCFVEFNNFEDTYTTYKYLNNCSNFYYEKDIYYVFDETANHKSLTKIKNINKFIDTIDLIELIYNESKLKDSCCISTFNYFLYLISLIENNSEWDYKKVEELKTKMKKLETIFLSNFDIIKKIQSDKNIKKYFNYRQSNNKKKIILIDGMSTTGKSTISDKLYDIFINNNINTKWIHEESFNEINLNLDLPKHSFVSTEKLKEEMENLSIRWTLFYDKIKNDEFTYILDSNFFKSIHDYMMSSELSIDEIKNYYNSIMDIFDEDTIQFILLKRENVKESLKNSFLHRGPFWESHFKKHIKEKCQSSSVVVEEDKIYLYEQKYQMIIEYLFDQFEVSKEKIVTDSENWDEYIKIICDALGLNILKKIENQYDYNKYLGEYCYENWNIKVFYNEEKNKLFLSAFWPNIELSYIGNDCFKLSRFPLHIKFNDDGVVFFGDLVWEMKNKQFLKKEKEVKNKVKIKKINND